MTLEQVMREGNRVIRRKPIPKRKPSALTGHRECAECGLVILPKRWAGKTSRLGEVQVQRWPAYCPACGEASV